MKNKVNIVITGVGGQDGHYMYALLRSKGYEILPIFHSFDNLIKYTNWTVSDISNEHLFKPIIERFEPDEIYNFGANSDNLNAFENPLDLLEANVKPVITILDYLKMLRN